jgi:hypothetical protein
MIEPTIATTTSKPGNDWQLSIEQYAAAGRVHEAGDPKAGVDVGKGWVPHGGLALRDVFHQGYSLARDIRVIGLQIFPEKEGEAARFLRLGPPDFRQIDETDSFVSPAAEFEPLVSQPRQAPKPFNAYNVQKELRVKWVSREPVFGKGSGPLFVTQRYLFTDYSDKPAHEPTGTLTASRLFPLVEIDYPAEYGGVRSVRIDYRLHLSLDPSLSLKMKEAKTEVRNQAAVFRDHDSLAEPVGRQILELSREALFNMLIMHGTAAPGLLSDGDVEFAAVEKPLVYEILADGLKAGSFGATWDNLHWWGFRGKNKPIISAPGAFHAVHLHWRWGRIVQSAGAPSSFLAPKSGSPQFAGSGMGGALVDRNIWIQTIRFAVAQYDKDTDPSPRTLDLKKLSTVPFADLFTNRAPQPIAKGGDLVLWYSVEVARSLMVTKDITLTTPLRGTVLIHGLYFAHESELTGWRIGPTTAQYDPPLPIDHKWFRNPPP